MVHTPSASGTPLSVVVMHRAGAFLNDFEPTVRFYEEHHEIALGVKPKGRMEIYNGIYNFAGDKLPLWCHGVAR